MITIYQWLTKYQALQREIDYIEFELDDYQAELRRWVGGNLSGVRLEKKSRASNLEPIIAQKEQELEVLVNRKDKLLAFIYKFDDVDSQILIKKYVEGKKLFVIAEELNCSESTVYKKHSELIKLIKFVDKFI